jgi:HPt (histidine-containing phosphotransfer) domain-containing protein
MSAQFTDSKEDPLARIEGLDLATGLYYAANKRALYEQLLKAFVANNADTVTDIRSAMAAQDGFTARTKAHSLKGLAATIGAKKLSTTAKALERALEEEQPEVVLKELMMLEEELDSLIQQISHALVELGCT